MQVRHGLRGHEYHAARLRTGGIQIEVGVLLTGKFPIFAENLPRE